MTCYSIFFSASSEADLMGGAIQWAWEHWVDGKQRSAKGMHVYILSITCTGMKKKTIERKPNKEEICISILQLLQCHFFPSQAYWLLAPVINTGRTITFHLEKTGDLKYSSQLSGLRKRESCQLLYIPLPLPLFRGESPQLKQPLSFTEYVAYIPGQTLDKIRLYSLADYKNKYNIQNFDCLFKIYLFSAYDDEFEKISGA